MKRVLLIGQGPTTATALASLVERFDVIGVVRRVDAGDGVAVEAAAAGIPLFQDASPSAVARLVGDLTPDCVVVSSYDRILPGSLLAGCPFVNVHYAPLPAYRGRATVNWAILNLEASTAITIHRLEPELDAGRILYQEAVAIGPDDTVTDVYAKLNAVQRVRLGRAVEALLDGTEGRPQDDTLATYACTRIPDDGEIDWRWPTLRIYALIRALTPPFPGAFTYLGTERILVWRARPVPHPRRYTGRVPGRVVSVSKAEGTVDVLTGDGVLRLYDLQLEAGPRAAAASVLPSVRLTLGLRPPELLKRIRTLERTAHELGEALRQLNEVVNIQRVYSEVAR